MQPLVVPMPHSQIAAFPMFGDDAGAALPRSVVPESSPQMLVPRPTKLRIATRITLQPTAPAGATRAVARPSAPVRLVNFFHLTS